MCEPAALSAAFAQAFASTGAAIQTIGTAVAVGGSIYQGISANAVAKANARQINAQNATERQIAAVTDQRLRERMRGQIAQQRSQLAARGVSLDSPTAIALGRTAAQELSFASQSQRSDALARSQELTASAAAARARATQELIGGISNAAGTMLVQAPKIWPGLGSGGRTLE